MPFQSEAQRRLFWAKVDKGEISKAKALEWEKETPNKKLPMHKKKTAGTEKVAISRALVSRVMGDAIERSGVPGFTPALLQSQAAAGRSLAAPLSARHRQELIKGIPEFREALKDPAYTRDMYRKMDRANRVLNKLGSYIAGTKRLQPSALQTALNKAKKPPTASAGGSGVQLRPVPSHVETQKARYLARTSGGPASAMDLGRTSVACEIAAYKDLFEK